MLPQRFLVIANLAPIAIIGADFMITHKAYPIPHLNAMVVQEELIQDEIVATLRTAKTTILPPRAQQVVWTKPMRNCNRIYSYTLQTGSIPY